REILDAAAEIYEPLAKEGVVEARVGLGRLLNSAARLHLEMNDSGKALAAAREAQDIFRGLADRAGGATPYLADRARSHEMLGEALWPRGCLDESLTHYRQAYAIRGQALATDPDNWEVQSDRAFAGLRIAEVLAEQGFPEEAEASACRAFCLCQDVARK